ncbi:MULTISPECIES: GTP pyrophosphokinase family protein [Bacillaceae]|jgi:putative GTP pyrophosphokinase|uniref:GTP pyrophosphokinase n=1 Tax=Gottfriedia luciferensis TaxID=178774 RepID=A0ABX2ZLK5_9BACI|nr:MULTISPECIES: GTP pyrophosphokinase family protein [Bacillaceae]ODG90229.1 GTP pyrophosphokinase [Gottfriedia luciferensis]PET64327.1 GTP pyrophosphokinase [Bacillus sp. AFS001701]PFH86297.1 GTP pyrophosphokinase [Bacillus sp. AFS088145]PGZ93672.1 GTP pyrophosphokinase [Bacillus sp. AFS029533]SFC99424.1 putative GTP pyrophosphokinase [Bacillus sp. UNCCL81]
MLKDQSLGEWTNTLLIYKFALDEINTKIRILNEEFTLTHNHNPIEHVKSRLKKPDSIIEKLERKGLELTQYNLENYMSDIAGVRISCSFISDIYMIYELLKQQDDIHIIEIKDYIKNPKPNGYKSFHMIIEIPIFLASETKRVKVEIQIRTVAMDFWASLEHKIFYKYNKKVPKAIIESLNEASATVNSLDYKMEMIRDQVEQLN